MRKHYTTKRIRLQNALIAEYDSLGAVYTAPPVSFTGSGTNSGNLLYFYHPDHLGSSSLITNADGVVTQHVEYIPFGEVFIEERNKTWNTPYLFNAKELDEETGLYYYGARYYDSRTSQFYSVDRFAEKFPWQSSYLYSSNNPTNFIDVNGDSTAVLNLGGTIGHTAMLIQNDESKWQYYSFNGNWVYDKSGGITGGKDYHDLGEKIFDSPQAFLESTYNTTGTKEQVASNEVNNYGYKEAFILPTNPEQDKTIRETFMNIANNENYSLGVKEKSNQCAQVVQRSLNAGGIQTAKSYVKVTPMFVDRKHGEIYYKQTIAYRNPYLPSITFRSIISNNSKGKHVNRKKR